MAVVELYAYNGPGMSPWHPADRRRPSRPPDWTLCVIVEGAGLWVRSIRHDWLSEWCHHPQSTLDILDRHAEG